MVGGKWIHISEQPRTEAPTFVDAIWFKYILSVMSATIAEGGVSLIFFNKTLI